MASFITKVRITFGDCQCERVGDDTIIFYPTTCHYQLKKFDIKGFIEKLDNLIQETPEIQERPYVELNYQMISSDKHFNMFGIEIPHITGACMDFRPKLDDIDSIAEEFFASVKRERFVEFTFIKVKFPGVDVLASSMPCLE